MPFELHAVL